MKQVFRRTAALFLCLTFLGSSVALASVALGDELHQFTIPLADGAALTTQMLWSNSKSDLRTENYITYKPGNSGLSPEVSYGPTVLSKKTVPNMATDLEKQGKRVLSGINGDFFVMATGDPLGIVITDGILRSSASYLCGVGFLADGRAIVGKPGLTVTANFSGYNLKVAEVNKVRTNTGYYLMSSDFAATTKNTEAGYDVVLAPVTTGLGETVSAADGQSVTRSDVLKIGSRVSCVVESVLDSSANNAIPQGKFILTVSKGSDAFLVEALGALKAGDTVDLDITSTDTRWNGVVSAIGGRYRVLEDGKVVEYESDSIAKSAAPRTAIGAKADGSVIFYTIDGRQSGLSVGATNTQVATRLAELGCVEAVVLDGGGSTTLGVTKPGSNGFEVVNSPSDGSLRAVTNALFLVSNLPPSGVPAHVYLVPQSRVLLPNGTTKIDSSFIDSNWHPVNASETLTWSAQKGSVTPDGVYTAAGTGEDVISVVSSSGYTGSTTVTVFPEASAISLTNEETGKAVSSLSLSANASVNLKAAANYRKIPLTVQDQSFTWAVSPASLGTITPDGIFTAADQNGTGTISITAGSHTATIPVTVEAQSFFRLLENFEGSTLSSIQAASGAKIDLAKGGDVVRFGTQSLRVAYSGDASLTGNFALPNEAGQLSVWVYGDKSGAALSAQVTDAAGAAQTVSLGTIDFSGWKRLVAALPAGATSLTGLNLGGTTGSGTIYLDQLLAANQTSADTSAPGITLSVTGTQLSAIVTDNSNAPFRQEDIAVTVDGQNQAFNFDAATGTVTAELLALTGELQRVSVQAADPYGNIGRAAKSVGYGSSTNTSFKDMKNHWAAEATGFLAARDIVKGENGLDGTYFYPDRSITRGDFALMTARWMGVNVDSYANVTLPFADAGKIPSWSLNAVKAMYSMGIMKGSQGTDGKLYANARASINRAEAMTILGRIQPKGYPEANLGGFSDAGSIPAWSKSYLASLVSQNVVSGFDGKVRPSDSVSRAELCKMLFTLW